jgi:hypothetical protein
LKTTKTKTPKVYGSTVTHDLEHEDIYERINVAGTSDSLQRIHGIRDINVQGTKVKLYFLNRCAEKWLSENNFIGDIETMKKCKCPNKNKAVWLQIMIPTHSQAGKYHYMRQINFKLTQTSVPHVDHLLHEIHVNIVT